MPKSKRHLKRRGKNKPFITKKTQMERAMNAFKRRSETIKKLNEEEENRRKIEGLEEETDRDKEIRLAIHFSNLKQQRKDKKKGTAESEEDFNERISNLMSDLQVKFDQEDALINQHKSEEE